jgi:hypothetical protein
MITAIPHRRPFLDKLRTSTLKRRLRLARWVARIRGRSKAPVTCRYFGADFTVTPSEAIGEEIAIKRYEWWALTMLMKACRRDQSLGFGPLGPASHMKGRGCAGCVWTASRRKPTRVAAACSLTS